MTGSQGVIAAVTRALALRLQDAVNQADGGMAQAQVTTRRPGAGDASQAPQINLYLFHVLPNAYLRNLHEPWRTQGRPVEQPVTALDLFYLISFLGSEETERLAPQRLLGITASALTVNAVLQPADLRAAGIDVATHTPSLEITPHSMTIEELSRLWTMFPQAPYQLSVCYRVSAALLVADVLLQPSPPIRGVAPKPGTLQPARIDAVAAIDGGIAVCGTAMRADGANFTPDMALSLDGVALPVDSIGPEVIAFTLDGAALRAGTGVLDLSRGGAQVASVPLAVGPVLDGCTAHVRRNIDAYDGRVAVTLRPAVQPGQTVELDLFSADQAGVGFGYRVVAPEGASPSRPIDVPVFALPPGRYAASAKVDGAPARLARDAAGAYLGPFLVVGRSRPA